MDSGQKQELLQVLHECMEVSNYCFDQCLQEDNLDMVRNCIRLDRECADFCQYVEGAIARDTPFVEELLQACATICKACADECDQHDHDHCKRCAEVCYRCAELCEKFTAA